MLTVAVITERQRKALVGCCESARSREREAQVDVRRRGTGFDCAASQRRAVAARSLAAQLSDGRDEVLVPVEIAEGIVTDLAARIEATMCSVVEDMDGPRGVHVRDGAEMVALLVELDTAITSRLTKMAG